MNAVLDFLNHLSLRSQYFRFLGHASLSAAKIRPMVCPTPAGGVALIAETAGRIVGFASYHRDPAEATRAEVAFAIADEVQGHGIGTRFLEQLAQLARTAGIDRFEAYVLAGNRRMLDVFRDSGFATTTANDHGVERVVLSLDVTPRFEERAALRSRRPPPPNR